MKRKHISYEYLVLGHSLPSAIDGEPRFGGRQRYEAGSSSQPARGGGGAYHTATLTIIGKPAIFEKVADVARRLGTQ